MSAKMSAIWLSYCIKSFHRSRFQRLQLLVTVQSNLSNTLKWQVRDRKFSLPLGWQKTVWSSENIRIRFVSRYYSFIWQIFFNWWIVLHVVWFIIRKTILGWKMKEGLSIFWMKVYVLNPGHCIYHRHKYFWLENSPKTILFLLGCLQVSK